MDLSSHSLFYLFGVLRRFQHCTGHITTGSWKGRGNQYIEFARVVYCKLPTNGKQLPAFPLKAVTGIEPRPQRWKARVLPLCHRGPPHPIQLPLKQYAYIYSYLMNAPSPLIVQYCNHISPWRHIVYLHLATILHLSRRQALEDNGFQTFRNKAVKFLSRIQSIQRTGAVSPSNHSKGHFLGGHVQL